MICGLDIMKKHGFKVDLIGKTMKIDNEDIFIPSSHELRQIRITSYVVLPAWSDNMVDVTIENADKGSSFLIDNNENYFARNRNRNTC